jgi:hypothetical protein
MGKGQISVSHIISLNAKLNPICHLLALLGAHHIPHVSRIRVKQKIHILLTKLGQATETEAFALDR